jgi:hypothetical protein
MSENVLLIHGWSARDKSMAHLGHFLDDHGYTTADLFLGGYPSMSDDVRVEDSARRMHDVILAMQAAGNLAARFHLIVHSTGALVARHWLNENYPGGGAPVDNFLMLAPANFGSPLATLGRSALVRIIKGWNRGFQTGTEMLHGLELGSRLQQDLATQDRLSPSGNPSSPYSDTGTRPYVIVGACPIPGTQITGQDAWDGTVRIASANFNPRGMTVDFCGGKLTEPTLTPWTRRGPNKTPFALLPDRNHLTILRPDPQKSSSKDPATSSRLGEMILAALAAKTAQAYQRIVVDWREVCNETRKLAQNGDIADALRKRILGKANANRHPFHEYYQIVVEAVDETGLPVEDFEVWLTAPKRRGRRDLRSNQTISRLEIDAHANLLKDEHQNRRNPERRVLHLDRRALLRHDGFLRGSVTGSYENMLAAGITAVSPGNKVAYFSRDARKGSGLIPLRGLDPSDANMGDRFLRRYATHFIRVVIPRVLDDDVFTIRPLA